MSSSSTSALLQQLVQNVVPSTKADQALRRDLVAHCQEILSSRGGQTKEVEVAHLGSTIKQRLLQSQSDSSALTAQRFTNLLSRLLEQDAVKRRDAALLFLDSLSASTTTSISSPPLTNGNTFLPRLSPLTTGHLPLPQTNGFGIISPATDRAPTGKTKATILREFRTKIGRPHIPEHILVRDSLYLLQGISGNYVHMIHKTNDLGEDVPSVVFRDSSRFYLPDATKDLITNLAELGYLYNRVATFVQGAEAQPSVGLIKQSLCHHLQSHLTDYYRTVAILESQLNTAKVDGAAEVPGLDTGLTLRRLDVWTEDWRLRMRMMSVCVEGSKETVGGALVSRIHSYTDNGDPFIRQFTDQLLEEVSKPFFATLHRWIYSGDLHDPFNEFFVAVDPHLARHQYAPSNSSFDADEGKDREVGAILWKSKYKFRKDMLPRFVGEDFGRKIFSTGRSLNFIRYSCQDSEWITTRSQLSTVGKVLKYSDISGLERTIDSAYQIASQRLFDVFFDKFKLLDHLSALRNYLLLGYGDFAEHLMETLAPHLSKPANNLQRHKLTSIMEAAIRATNAQFDPPDVLRRLDARMMEFTHGEIGWDVFMLEYKVDSPIDTVLDPGAIRQYLRLFGHLWRMKRVDTALTACWMRITSGSKAFLRVPELEGHWHQVRIAMSEMIFFIRQLQNYAHLVVIESCWRELRDFLKKKEGDLDSLIEAHQEYLSQLMTRVLLLRQRQGKEEQYLTQVKEAFDFALSFVDAVDGLYNYSLNEAARLDAERDIDRGVHTRPTSRSGRRTPEGDNIPRTLRRIREYSMDFSERALNVAIGVQGHEDPKCKVLGQMLAFSDFYPNKRQRLKEEQQTALASAVERT